MIYLDHAATGGTKPACVHNAVRAALAQCANPGRSGHGLSLACAERVLACRRALDDLFGGYGFERVIFTKNCTEALNLMLLGTLKQGDHVIATCLEHNSVLRPLAFLQKQGVIEYSVAPLNEGRLQPETVAALVRENTVAAVITAASNVTGECPDPAAFRALLPQRVLLFCDGAQAGGHVEISMRRQGIDALALAGHKGLHAIQGIGALLCSERVSPRPLLFGGTGSDSANADMPAFYPDRLESGTLPFPAICSLLEGALLVSLHRAEYGKTLTRLTGALLNGLRALPAYEVFSAPNPCGIVSFSHRSIASEELAELLFERFSIAVRGGLHCAPLVHKALGSFPHGLVRASFSPFQGMREVRALLSALGTL